MMNLKSFSQNDTINSTIQLTKPVAKLVIKDLINADGLSLELKTTQDLLNSTNLKLKTQTELVGNLQTQIYNFENIVISKDEQLFTSEKLSKDLEEALKRQKRQTTIFKIGTRRQNDGSNDTDTTMNLGISYYTIPFDSETASGTQTGVYASSNITVPNNSAHYLTNLDGEFSGIVIPANSWVLMAVKAAAIDGATTADIYFNGSLTFKKS